MTRIPRALAVAAAALLIPATAASGATFTGTTDQGVPISFEATGDQLTQVSSQLTMVCTGRAGIEPFQPSATFVANGAESKASELRPSAVLNRDATQNFGVTATVAGTQASGKIALNYATTDFDLLTMTTRVTVCAGSAAFSATAPAATSPPPTSKPASKSKAKKKHRKGKRHGAKHALKLAASRAVVPQA
jgi:hypothetical protein